MVSWGWAWCGEAAQEVYDVAVEGSARLEVRQVADAWQLDETGVRHARAQRAQLAGRDDLLALAGQQQGGAGDALGLGRAIGAVTKRRDARAQHVGALLGPRAPGGPQRGRGLGGQQARQGLFEIRIRATGGDRLQRLAAAFTGPGRVG